MEALLIVAATAFVCVCCFIIGAQVGQKVSKGEDISLPSVDPMKVMRERAERKEAQKEQDKIDTILQNIDRYDGTGSGQKDVLGG